LEPIRPDLEQVECLLHDTLADVEEPLGSVLRHSLNGGKRLRSALVILVGRMFAPSDLGLQADCCPLAGRWTVVQREHTLFHRLAAALDMLHAATLIHDDLLDEAHFRRGHETLHTVWPAGAAVLAGDCLLGQAISLIADLDRPRICKVFAGVLCTMCAGEIRQMVVPRGTCNGREDYDRSIAAKTASLFAASTEMAGLLADAGEPQIAALRRFGHEFGMAFQIVDDVLDLIGGEAQLGKPAGSDLRRGLVTLPILCYLERVRDDAVVSAVLAGQRDEEHVRAALAAIRSSGAIEAALEEARAHIGRSQEALVALPDNAARQMLWSLADYVVARRQ
jgi:geranylgeranyl pyrophosphate synthase